MSEHNRKLHEMGFQKGRKCPACGRSYPDTVLNLEGIMHHRDSGKCVDRKSCERAKRKNK